MKLRNKCKLLNLLFFPYHSLFPLFPLFSTHLPVVIVAVVSSSRLGFTLSLHVFFSIECSSDIQHLVENHYYHYMHQYNRGCYVICASHPLHILRMSINTCCVRALKTTYEIIQDYWSRFNHFIFLYHHVEQIWKVITIMNGFTSCVFLCVCVCVYVCVRECVSVGIGRPSSQNSSSSWVC